MVSSPKFTMLDPRITPPVWKQKYCPNCWGKKINQNDEVCKECKWEAARPPKPPDPYLTHLAIFQAVKWGYISRPCCAVCGNQLSNDMIKLGLTNCTNCTWK